MRLNTFRKNSLAVGCGLLPAIAMCLSAGCHEFPNTFTDDLPGTDTITTASMHRAQMSTAESVRWPREFEEYHIGAQSGVVAHAPLWMEDPYEMNGSNDGRFKTRGEDYVYFWYGTGRFFVNLVLMPFSMVFDHVGDVQCSDGVEQQSRRRWLPAYDAEPCQDAPMPPDAHPAGTYAATADNSMEPAADEAAEKAVEE